MKNKRRLFLLIFFSLFILILNHIYITIANREFIFNNSDDIPKTEFALFLGTPKYLSNGKVNNYYKNRIKSVIELYTKNKVHRIIISADSLNKYKENEVALIKEDLIKEGIDETDLILDKDGNSTWKSIKNLEIHKNINKIILVSQKFHLERALYIAKKNENKSYRFSSKRKND